MPAPLLSVQRLAKRYTRGLFTRDVTFSLEADFAIPSASIVGVMGPNGSGKTTLFELITGSNLPSAGQVLVEGHDIHRVRYAERDRLAIHYHQSYQVRAWKRTRPSFMLDAAQSDSPRVHLFDEPQFNTQDGYIGFMLQFFRKLRADGRLVFLCLHPNESWHVEILRETCDSFIYVDRGQLTHAADFAALCRDQRVRSYLGALAPSSA
ncbi:MAG: ATP-binding cassette domain-containing protein [Betaproteobacteria bacterium]